MAIPSFLLRGPFASLSEPSQVHTGSLTKDPCLPRGKHSHSLSFAPTNTGLLPKCNISAAPSAKQAVSSFWFPGSYEWQQRWTQHALWVVLWKSCLDLGSSRSRHWHRIQGPVVPLGDYLRTHWWRRGKPRWGGRCEALPRSLGKEVCECYQKSLSSQPSSEMALVQENCLSQGQASFLAQPTPSG